MFWDAFIKVHVSKYGIFILLVVTSNRLRLEFTNILQDIIIPLRFLLPFLMVIGGPGTFNSLQDFLVGFGYTLELSLSALFAQWVRIVDTVVCTVDAAFCLHIRESNGVSQIMKVAQVRRGTPFHRRRTLIMCDIFSRRSLFSASICAHFSSMMAFFLDLFLR